MAVRKTGVDSITKENVVRRLSGHSYCLTADHAPARMPRTVPISDPRISRRRLTPMRRFISGQIGSPSRDLPKSALTTPPTHFLKRVVTGTSSFWFASLRTLSIDDLGGGGFRSA